MELNTHSKKFIKGLSTIMGTRIMLTDNKIKGIIKVIRSLENKRILLKGTTRKSNSPERGLLNFLLPLTRVALP